MPHSHPNHSDHKNVGRVLSQMFISTSEITLSHNPKTIFSVLTAATALQLITAQEARHGTA